MAYTNVTSSHSTRHFHLRKSISPAPPEGHFLLANFSQKFDQKLPSGLDAGLYSQTFHKRSTKKRPPPEGHFLLANFSQKFDQKLASDPKGSFYSIFCEKIVWMLRPGFEPESMARKATMIGRTTLPERENIH